MSKAYIKAEDGSTTPMDRVRCKNEDEELQSILDLNPDLLPGDQIKPEEPRRWLNIARELPVPDPGTGTDRWSIDHFFSDQSAMPTFIECKRFRDTRARREVIGQMFEYAANGHYYWTKEMLKAYAEGTAEHHRTTLDTAYDALRADDDLDIDAYFERLESNLREGQVRLVFFMEEAPAELKSLVEFLNKQMERSEVLLVEARQYRHDGVTVVVPTLFGYSEEARQVKRTVTVTSAARKYWDYETYFEEARRVLGDADSTRLERLYKACEELSCTIRWGTGKTAGSFLVSHPMKVRYAFMSVYTNGLLTISFQTLQENEAQMAFRDALRGALVERMGLKITDEDLLRYPGFQKDEWLNKADIFIDVLKELVPKYQ